jgi:hypothetical protein
MIARYHCPLAELVAEEQTVHSMAVAIEEATTDMGDRSPKSKQRDQKQKDDKKTKDKNKKASGTASSVTSAAAKKK